MQSLLRPCGLACAALLAIGPATGQLRSPAPRVVTATPVEVSLAKLTSIDYKRGQELPVDIKELDGQRVSIRGFMALDTLEGETVFPLVTDSCGCGQSKVHHFVEVSLTEGTTTYTPQELTVIGELSVGEVTEDGFVLSLYRLTAESVE